MAAQFSSLCRPDDQKSCFACCPPIRPSRYDHADFKTTLRRQLWDNTISLRESAPKEKIITGYSCWGLGFLDQRGIQAGCLLHPAQNQGRDLRDLTGYGDKCRRELCREAVVFSELSAHLGAFVLNLSAGLDCFDYSSRKRNPVFTLLNWGSIIIEHVSRAEPGGLTRKTFHEKYAFLEKELDPHRDAFALELMLGRLSLETLRRPEFLIQYKETLARFKSRHERTMSAPVNNQPYVHQLDLPPPFIRFLRHGLGWSRALPSRAETVKSEFEGVIKRFMDEQRNI
ncbi:MAG: hypothetical protein JRD68_16400 [Deltaproteobacteria bacterium]|nr:hypothetical protein [Deltaproteobacteria bacterium]